MVTGIINFGSKVLDNASTYSRRGMYNPNFQKIAVTKI